MSSIDSATPFLSSAIFSVIFKKTISDFPGACFFVQATLLLIPIFVIFWIDLFTKVPSDIKNNPKKHDPDEITSHL